MDTKVIDTNIISWVPHRTFRGVQLRSVLGSDISSDLEVRMASLEPGAEIAPHVHPHSAETFYFLCGEGVLTSGDEGVPCHAGHCVHAPAGISHSVKNTGSEKLQLLAIFTPPTN